MKFLPEGRLHFDETSSHILPVEEFGYTMSSTRKSLVENWLLVQWTSGGRDVVHVNSVVNPVNKEFKNGQTLTVTRRGEEEQATLIAHARERNTLEAMIVKNEDMAGPSGQGQGKDFEDGEDFSSDDSEWVPSDNGAQSCDSDAEVDTKKIKLEHYKRQYSRSNKKILTPSNRANAVPVNTVNRKRTHKETVDLSQDKSKPDSTKLNETAAQKLRDQINDFNNTFKMLFDIISDVKKQKLSAAKAGSKEHTTPVLPNLNAIDRLYGSTSQSNQAVGEDKENESDSNENEEFNRSDDNVLISNKYSNIVVETVQKNNAVEEEWIPIGSGKTMIHKDKYKKVNWKSYTIATRTLLVAAFPRRVLATHSLTGKASPAFQNKPVKMSLDQKIISDVISEVMDRFKVRENLVRNIITTKCADECKMWKIRNKKKKNVKNEENSTTA